LEDESRQEAFVRGDGEGTATLDVDTCGVTRSKDLVRMRIPIWYDAMQAPDETAGRIARERGARPEAWLAPVRETAGSSVR
jgi:hypothetical protein